MICNHRCGADKFCHCKSMQLPLAPPERTTCLALIKYCRSASSQSIIYKKNCTHCFHCYWSLQDFLLLLKTYALFLYRMNRTIMSRSLLWPWRRGGPKRWEFQISSLSSLLYYGEGMGDRKLFTVLRIKVSVSSSIFSRIPENFRQSFLENCSKSSRQSSIFRVLDFRSLVFDTKCWEWYFLELVYWELNLQPVRPILRFFDKLSSKSLSSWRFCERFWDTSESE